MASFVFQLIYTLVFLYATAYTTDGVGSRNKRQVNQPPSGSGSQRVNQICRFNTDCITGAFCANGVCECWSTHIDVNTYCWPKINPDQSGCQYEEQCSAVWPGARCEKSICRCPFNRPPQMTRDGPVCYLPGSCPTNDQWPKMKQTGSSAIQNCALLAVNGVTEQLGCGVYDDMYDCIDAHATTQKEGYCCPTRAFACIQPMESGSSSMGGASATRFYFNPITHSCQEFRYLGAGGNANNFVSFQQCESYCRQACKRGHPQYTPVNPTNNVSASVKFCSTTTTTTTTTSSECGANYNCQQQGSLQLCCPRVSYVCSASGGLPANAGKEGTPAMGIPISVRWYYDTVQKRCLTFSYEGQGGNFNNFLSRDDCEAFCAQALCERGEPLKDASGLTALTCSSNTQCPSTHECKARICCPSKYTVCNQPKVTGGSCNNYATRFWYNVKTGACEQFLFTGCRGNANNFETFLHCQSYCNQVAGEPQCKQGSALKDSYGNFYTCSGGSGATTTCPPNYECYYDGSVYGCCPSRAYTCSLTASTGTVCGPSSSTRWFFDPTNKSCKTFLYLGCDGNSNNFATQRDCKDFCRVGGCPDGGEPFRDFSGQIQFCGSTTSNVCPSTHSCVTVSANSVGISMGNIPLSQRGTYISYCCPTKSTICSQSSDAGANCGVSLVRQYFNTAIKRCESFSYLGCGGNSNNFPDAIACQQFCESSACSAGEEIYRDPNTLAVKECILGGIGNCPRGYDCVLDRLSQRYVCCGAPTGDVCANDVKAYIDAFTGQPRHCTPNVMGSCPGDYVCYYNQIKRQSYCCEGNGIDVAQVCGAQAVYLVNGRALECAGEAAPQGCPSGYVCQRTRLSSTSTSYYCCQSSVSPPLQECPSGFQPSKQWNGQPQYCNPYLSTTCSPQSICQYMASSGRYQCCSSGNALQCRNGQSPSTFNGQVQACTLGLGGMCPANYICTTATNNIHPICCPTGATTNALCPGNLQPYVLSGRPLVCGIGVVNSCPAGYRCQNAAGQPFSSATYCCPDSISSSQCSGNRQPYLVFGSQPQTCTPYIPNSCPRGYQCEMNTRQSMYICCQANLFFSNLFRKRVSQL